MEKPPLIVVDAANVIGSRPDGWWRDRAAALARLRDELVGTAGTGLADLPPPVEVVLVAEGRARGVPSVPDVRVVSADGSGDDAIVALVRAAPPGRVRVVVTADRELRQRVAALGARPEGPGWLRRALSR
nr:hypothetical protein [Micromonospora sp. DSM 115978]